MRYDKIKISRFISLILRHKPEVIGITIDSNGWANTKDLGEYAGYCGCDDVTGPGKWIYDKKHSTCIKVGDA